MDHGRFDEIGCWDILEKIARFKNLKDFCRVSQNDLAFMGRIGKVSLSEFLEIYGQTLCLYFIINFRFFQRMSVTKVLA
jgi:hypothetical protein